MIIIAKAMSAIPKSSTKLIVDRGSLITLPKHTQWTICFLDKATGRVIGNSGLHRIDWTIPKFEIGYWCRTSETSKGYVTEVVRGLTKLCFEKLNAARVEIRCDDLNVKSAAVAERCGFKLEGVLKNDERNTKGELRTTRIYGLTSLEDLK